MKINLLDFPYSLFKYKFLSLVFSFLEFLHLKHVVCAGLHTLHLEWRSHHTLIWRSIAWPGCNHFDFDFYQIEKLPDDSPFSLKVNLKQQGCEQQQIQVFSHPPDYIL